MADIDQFVALMAVADKKVRDFFKRVEAEVADVVDRVHPAEGWFQMTQDSAQTGVIRVDVVLTALQLMTAQIVFRAVPRVWKKRLEAIQTNLITTGQSIAAAKLAKKIPGIAEIRTALTFWKRYAELAEIEKEIEAEIRFACAPVRHDFQTAVLERAHKKSQVRDVLSRHKTPRKKNRFHRCKSR